jgi:hypothetical protein
MAQDGEDRFYTEAGRNGPKNALLRQLNRDRSFSGMSGYPSNDDYMRLVGDAKGEQQRELMRDAADAENARIQRRQPNRAVKRTPPKVAAKRK